MLKEILFLSMIPSVVTMLAGFSGYADMLGGFSAPEPVIELIDGHADTITTAMDAGQGMRSNSLQLDFERLLQYQSPVQVFAVWLDDEYTENAFEYAVSAIDFFEREISAHSDIIEIALSLEDIERNARNGKISAILALEGGEPLEGKMENLDYFYGRGVRLITLTWNRENELGYGVSTGSEKGLKPFGKACVKRMNELGVIIDVSHLNEAGFRDVHELSEKPYVASHSNAYSVAVHRRNLKDEQVRAIVEKGGLIGVNTYPYFVTGEENASINDVLAHVTRFIELGAGGNIGLGCDFDGIDVTTKGLEDVSKLKTLGTQLTQTFGADVSRGVMSENYYAFLKRFFS